MYKWDLRGQMVGIDTNDDGTADVTYTYDSGGVRVSQSANGDTTNYLQDKQNPTGYAKAIEDRTDTGSNGSIDATTSYILGTQVIGQVTSTDTYFMLLDGHGSTAALTSTSGALVEEYAYTAFGEAIGFDANTAKTNWLFGGDGIWDAKRQMTYHLARWRDGHRFVSYDSFEANSSIPTALHKYVYASGNPVHYVDLNGNEFSMPGMLTGIGITSVVGAMIGGTVGGVSGMATGQGFWKGCGSGAVSGFISTAVPLTIYALGGTLLPPYLTFGLGGVLGELSAQLIFGDVGSASGVTTIILSGIMGGTMGRIFGAGSVESLGVLAQKLTPAVDSVLSRYALEISLDGVGGALRNSAKSLFDDIFVGGGVKTGRQIADGLKFFFTADAPSDTGALSAFVTSVTTSAATTGGNMVIDLGLAAIKLIERLESAFTANA